MLSCQQITELVSIGLDTRIPWPQRMKMKLHFLMCRNCRCYAKQLRFMQRLILAFEQQARHVTLPNDARQRIAKCLQTHEGD